MNKRAAGIETMAVFIIVFIFSAASVVIILTYFMKELSLLSTIFTRATCNLEALTQNAIAMNIIHPILNWMSLGAKTVGHMLDKVAGVIDWVQGAGSLISFGLTFGLMVVGAVMIGLSFGAATPAAILLVTAGVGSIGFGLFGVGMDQGDWAAMTAALEVSRDAIEQTSHELDVAMITGSNCGGVVSLSQSVPETTGRIAGLIDKCYYMGDSMKQSIVCDTVFIEPSYGGYSTSLSWIKKVDECAVTYILASTYDWRSKPGNAVCEVCDSHGTHVSTDSPSTFCSAPAPEMEQVGDSLVWHPKLCRDGMVDYGEYCAIEISYSAIDKTVHLRTAE